RSSNAASRNSAAAEPFPCAAEPCPRPDARLPKTVIPNAVRDLPRRSHDPSQTQGTTKVMAPAETNPPATCPACGCTNASGARAHTIAAALLDDDLDRAMTLGLLEPVACSACTGDCSE